MRWLSGREWEAAMDDAYDESGEAAYGADDCTIVEMRRTVGGRIQMRAVVIVTGRG